jgi:hypothetical protein
MGVGSSLVKAALGRLGTVSDAMLPEAEKVMLMKPSSPELPSPLPAPQAQLPDYLQRAEQAGFTQDVYRGASGGIQDYNNPNVKIRGRWWSDRPDTAQAFNGGYAGESHVGYYIHNGYSPVTFPGKLNTEGFVVIDGEGSNWTMLPKHAIEKGDPEILQWLYNRYGKHYSYSTDNVADAVQNLNRPGVVFKNTEDNGIVDTQYYVNDLTRRRGRFAKFQDLTSEDLMAGIPALAAAGVGAGLAANKDEANTPFV